ncbi:MAG: hydrogenase maturation protease [Clostridium sp.]
MIKIFGVGNIMLCDDGIGVKVAEFIKEKLYLNGNINNLDNKLNLSERALVESNNNRAITSNNKSKLVSGDIEVIIGETDFMYCLDCIDKDDLVIIIDGTYFEFKPGHISKLSFDECDKFIYESRDPHSDSLLQVLRREYRDVKGYLIGIEIGKVDYSLELSTKLNKEFNSICERVLAAILNLLKVNKVKIVS